MGRRKPSSSMVWTAFEAICSRPSYVTLVAQDALFFINIPASWRLRRRLRLLTLFAEQIRRTDGRWSQ